MGLGPIGCLHIERMLSLIHFGYEKVHMEYRLWWAFQLHRHKHFVQEIYKYSNIGY